MWLNQRSLQYYFKEKIMCKPLCLSFLSGCIHTQLGQSLIVFCHAGSQNSVWVCVCLCIQRITLRVCVCHCWQWPREWAWFPNPLLKRTAASSCHIKHTDFRRWNVNGLIICRKLCWWGSFWSAGSVSKVTVLEPNPTETEVRSKLLQNFFIYVLLFVWCHVENLMFTWASF